MLLKPAGINSLRIMFWDGRFFRWRGFGSERALGHVPDCGLWDSICVLA